MTTTDTNVELRLCVKNNPSAEHHHEGRFYVAAEEGTEYSLRLTNNNPHGVLAVISLDGVNILNGRPATGREDDSGYVLGAHESQTIKGYRVDSDNAAAFKFTKASASYAQADKGLTGTTGVIGVKVWAEQEQPKPVVKEEHHHHHHNHWNDWNDYYHPFFPSKPTWPKTRPWYNDYVWSSCDMGVAKGQGQGSLMRSMASPQGAQQNQQHIGGLGDVTSFSASLCSAESAAASETATNPFVLGSTWGQRTESKVTEVEFKVGRLMGVMELFYTTREGLKALGVDLTRAQKVAFPKAFDGRYASPPSGWKG